MSSSLPSTPSAAPSPIFVRVLPAPPSISVAPIVFKLLPHTPLRSLFRAYAKKRCASAFFCRERRLERDDLASSLLPSIAFRGDEVVVTAVPLKNSVSPFVSPVASMASLSSPANGAVGPDEVASPLLASGGAYDAFENVIHLEVAPSSSMHKLPSLPPRDPAALVEATASTSSSPPPPPLPPLDTPAPAPAPAASAPPPLPAPAVAESLRRLASSPPRSPASLPPAVWLRVARRLSARDHLELLRTCPEAALPCSQPGSFNTHLDLSFLSDELAGHGRDLLALLAMLRPWEGGVPPPGCPPADECGGADEAGRSLVESVDLSGSCAGDAALGLLAGVPGVRTVSVRGCAAVGSAGVSALLAGLPRLYSLDVSGCHKVSDRCFAGIAGCVPELRQLVLADLSRVTARALGHIAALSRLAQLDLSGCTNFPGSALHALRSMSLCSLCLMRCRQVGARDVASMAGSRLSFTMQLLRLNGTAVASAGDVQDFFPGALVVVGPPEEDVWAGGGEEGDGGGSSGGGGSGTASPARAAKAKARARAKKKKSKAAAAAAAAAARTSPPGMRAMSRHRRSTPPISPALPSHRSPQPPPYSL